MDLFSEEDKRKSMMCQQCVFCVLFLSRRKLLHDYSKVSGKDSGISLLVNAKKSAERDGTLDDVCIRLEKKYAVSSQQDIVGFSNPCGAVEYQHSTPFFRETPPRPNAALLSFSKNTSLGSGLAEIPFSKRSLSGRTSHEIIPLNGSWSETLRTEKREGDSFAALRSSSELPVAQSNLGQEAENTAFDMDDFDIDDLEELGDVFSASTVGQPPPASGQHSGEGHPAKAFLERDFSAVKGKDDLSNPVFLQPSCFVPAKSCSGKRF